MALVSKVNIIKAVVGVLRNQSGQLLIAKRQKHQFMSGFWELPGGKIEPFETPEQAIIRELKEELGVQTKQLSCHQTMMHRYPDRTVKLYIYNIDDYFNTPKSMEGQQIAWVSAKNLQNYPLLPTMRAFIHSISLPDKYWITPSINHQSDGWLAQFEQKLTQNIKLIQLRSKVKLDSTFIKELSNKCHQHSVKFLLNTIDKTFNERYCDGWHITTQELLKLDQRPCPQGKLLGVSTHNLDEAFRAQNIGADFVVISPVQATPTHPNTTPIGWKMAQNVVDKLNIPVYFLGGMGLEDLNKTLKIGAQGIAGVSAF